MLPNPGHTQKIDPFAYASGYDCNSYRGSGSEFMKQNDNLSIYRDQPRC